MRRNTFDVARTLDRDWKREGVEVGDTVRVNGTTGVVTDCYDKVNEIYTVRITSNGRHVGDIVKSRSELVRVGSNE